MDENKSPADRLLDLVVFGPAGLALAATEEFPKLVDKGRHHLEGQVRTARLVGQVAIQMGRRQFDQFVSQRSAKPAPSAPKAPAPAPAPAPAEYAAPTTTPAGAGATAETTTANGAATGPKTAASNGSSATNAASTKAGKKASVNGAAADGSVAGSLAIPGYDSLSASQVVQRLAGLSRAELIEVRAYEQAQRHRRTILNRVEQLLAGVDAD